MMGFFQYHLPVLCGLLLITSTTATLPPDSHGSCDTYIIQGGDTCASIASAHGITVADIEKYNVNTYAWYGCSGTWYQGNFICLGPGDPPMPVALPQATCGPQVPGTTRPNSWSELPGLNPCSSSECCTIWGQCSTGNDCSRPEVCVDNCQAGATGKPPAPKPTQRSNTSSINPPPTKTTLRTSSKDTEAIRTMTTTKAETFTKTNEATKTVTVTPTPPVVTWSLSIYDGYTCDGNYYTLEGHNTGNAQCISIQNGHLSTSSDADTWCRYYTDGGFNSTSCHGGPVFEVWSWILHGGDCYGYEHDCGDPTPGGQSQSIGPYPQCSVISEADFGGAINWRSILCTARKPSWPGT